MIITKEDGNVKIELSGRIDSVNAPDIEKEIWEKADLTNCRSVLIDAEKLSMLSSARLRIVLKMQKLCPSLKIVGVNSDVYDVFEMTGFTEIISIEKSYRKLSVDGCTILGEGSNGIVYRYDPETVIKVYRNANALDEIKRERELARRALILGVPTAIPFDVVKVGDLYGSVFELLNAKTFSELITEAPEKTEEYIRLFVELAKKLHSTRVETEKFDSAKKRALEYAVYLKDYLPEKHSEKLLSLIQTVPDRNTMVHGDFHFNNVEMQNGEVLLIDMDTLSYGHPVFELANTFLAFVGFGEIDPNVVRNFLKLDYDVTVKIWRRVLELYFNTSDETLLKQAEDKIKTVGYMRILRRTIKRIGVSDPNGKAMAEFYKDKILKLIEKNDSLDFDCTNDSISAKVKEITLKAAVENVYTVTEFIDKELDALKCAQKARMQINIAVDELFSNIAKYAYNPKEGMATVRIEVADDPLAVVISFMDDGVPYDPLKNADPNITLSAEEREMGGLGIFMVKKSMDDVAYEYKDGKNILRIKKNI